MVQSFIFGPVLADVFCSATASSKILIGFALSLPHAPKHNNTFKLTHAFVLLANM